MLHQKKNFNEAQALNHSYQHYQSSLGSRYTSPAMNHLHSAQKKHATWRRIWTELARAQMELGLAITPEHIQELEQHIDSIDFDNTARYEKQVRHDVMAHVHAYADQCPQARSIIHLGATSCLITDNTDIIIIKESLVLIQQQLITLVRNLRTLAHTYKDLPCLAFTHYQPAQPTTVGKRCALWLHDFVLDMRDLTYRLDNLALLGIKGATGTQASFLQLFGNDHTKVELLEQKIVQRLGFTNVVPISGQTYTRKIDMNILNLLASIATSAHKMATDMRLLANLQELEEPFEAQQIGSSAMPYKRNPMRAERICSLSRYMMSLAQNPMYTAATQWLERTLDDSANRRLCIPEAFLTVDGILQLCINVTNGLVVNKKIIEHNLARELPFMATESILMASVQKGANRQIVHEIIRQTSMQVGHALKQEGKENDLLQRLADNPTIPLTYEEILALVKPEQFIGRAPEQVVAFIEHEVDPLLAAYAHVKQHEGQITI